MQVVDQIKAQVNDSALNDEGYLVVSSVPIARPGVFPYMRPDGLSEQAKLPEELFSQATIESANGKPITNDHPNFTVNADNNKEVSVGMTMNDAAVKNNMLTVSMVITDPDTIADVQAGKRELSIGFITELSQENGVYNGDAYDVVQRNMRINHVAIVERGRAGSDISIGLDSADDMSVSKGLLEIVADSKDDFGGKEMKEIILDGQTIDLTAPDAQAKADEVIKSLKKTELTNDAALDQITSLNSKVDTLTGERDAYKTKAEKLEQDAANIEDKVQERVKSRIELETKAKEVIGDSADLSGSDRDIKMAVVKKVNGIELADSVSDDYLNGAFSVAMANNKAMAKSKSNVDWSDNSTITDSDSNQELRQARQNLNKK